MSLSHRIHPGRQILDPRRTRVEVDVMREDGPGRAEGPSGAEHGRARGRRAARRRKKRWLARRESGVDKSTARWPPSSSAWTPRFRRRRRAMIEMGGTPTGQAGANALLGVSMPSANPGGSSLGLPLYALGWPARRHAARADDENSTAASTRTKHVDFQEFMIQPGDRQLRRRHPRRRGIYHALRKVLQKNRMSPPSPRMRAASPRPQGTTRTREW